MFSADWLTLREPADCAARSARLTREVAAVLDQRRSLAALDLAAGTGANVRYLTDHLDGVQHWLLADHDQMLLAHVPERMSTWALARGGEIVFKRGQLRFERGGDAEFTFATRFADLRALDDPAIFDGRALVAASALLDLVSDPWLRALAARCRHVEAVVLFALTYDGRIRCSPSEPEDEMIRELVNQHQRTEKGFGHALGPGAVAAAERCFAALGYTVRREPSDWRLGAGTADLQRQLIDGWAEAASAMASDDGSSIERWRTRRLEHVDHERSQLIVGHEDLAAWLDPGPPAAA
jgi:hypothetical protein